MGMGASPFWSFGARPMMGVGRPIGAQGPRTTETMTGMTIEAMRETMAMMVGRMTVMTTSARLAKTLSVFI